ncbi:MAG: multidrug efflux transporter permease subunit, partial [Phenylobacterium sp.]|nr:multidrug efflux transporter permease subunit [Phenylobacterium sp.]
LTIADVTTAITGQNAQVSAGQIGQLPASKEQELNATVSVQSRLQTPEQFGNIRLVTASGGAIVHLRDVARLELGAERYGFETQYNGKNASGFGVRLASGANALDTVDAVKAQVQAIAKNFPPDVKVAFPYDSTPFVRLSVEQVVHTLVEAIVLVFLVMFLFLQNWRATLIPTIAVPVVLLGAFGVMSVLGYSINTLTLFGMVLAIGLLVDDAIVVVENVERLIQTEHLSPKEAARKSMDEISGALIGIGMVLSAVFLPMAFFGGSVGVIYRQFSITIVSSMALSVLVALVLSPALAATLLKPPGQEHQGKSTLDRLLQRFGGRFNDWFNRNADRYQAAVRRVIDRSRVAMVVYGIIFAILVALFLHLPTSFLPQEDQGLAQIQYTLPPGATQSRTLAVARTIENYFLTQEKADVAVVYTVTGVGPQGAGQNAGRGFLSFTPWSQRTGAQDSAQAITRRATQKIGAQLRDAQFFALNPPPVRGLGQSSGFTLELLNTGSLPREQFKAKMNQLMTQAGQDPTVTGVRLNALQDTPTLHINVETDKAGALGLTQAQINSTIASAWGGTYVNDFVDRGRVKRVYVQGDAPYRSRPEDLGDWYVRTASGTMAPFSAFAQIAWSQAPSTLTRFNGTPSYEIQGDAAPGQSTGQAMARMTQIAESLGGVSVDWSGLSYQERLSGGQAPLLYGVSLLVVFLCLAALYESWSVPFSVLLVIPLGLVGAAIAVALRGLSNDVYFQVGLLTTMGLSAKNAILIVEFAEAAEKQGKGVLESALEAARLRLRPILMTSLAFIFGVLPLAIATGAGAQSRIAIGTAVIGGMLTATALAIFFVPMFFVLVRRIFRGHREPAPQAPDAPPPGPEPSPERPA